MTAGKIDGRERDAGGQGRLGRIAQALILGLIFVAISPFVLFFHLWMLPGRLRDRRFRVRHRGRWFLVATRRHGWHEFTRDAVAPALPDGMEVAWFERPGRREQREPVLRACYSAILEQEKPFLLQVDRSVKECRVVPLHDRVRPLLDGGDWRRPEVVAAVRREIDAALAEAGAGEKG